ncbi:MAG TPA: hypothetical protein VEK08_02430 [Planctomycetota bacterium]|nr:hypothetical protein [Planctomycetota bacterium]
MGLSISVSEVRLVIGGDAVRYDAYCLGWRSGGDLAAVVTSILRQWAKVLEESANGQSVYLPYSPDDQSISCFRATLLDDLVVLRCVDVAQSGFELDFNNITGFCRTQHLCHEEYTQDFGTYGRSELIDALRRVEFKFENE